MLDFHGYGPSIFKGATLTLEVAFLSLALALVLGVISAVARLSNNSLARSLSVIYTTIIRGVPDLVLMLLFYFGAQVGLNTFSDWLYERFDIDVYFNLDPFTAGVVTIGFIFGAYMAETFRGAFLAVDAGQIEAGQAYGMSKFQVFYHITLPQMLRHALPGLGNNWLVLVKATALVSIIGLVDMVRLAKEAAGSTQEPFLFFIPVAMVYLAITFVTEFGLNRLEKRLSVGDARY